MVVVFFSSFFFLFFVFCIYLHILGETQERFRKLIDSLKTKYMSNRYVINYVEIKLWPPCKNLGTIRSAFIQGKHDDNNSSGSTSGVPVEPLKKKGVPVKGKIHKSNVAGVSDGKIVFESFKLDVTLPTHTLVKFLLYQKNKFEEKDALATAVIDFAKYGIVQESLMIMGVPMKCHQRYDGVVLPPMLFVTMQAVDRSLTPPGEMYKKSIDHPAGFWSDNVSKFYKELSKNLDVTKEKINNIEGFKGGEDSNNNICHHCLDKNIELFKDDKDDKDALIWEGKERNVNGKLTYRELLKKVCQLANFLKDEFDVIKGDNVIIFLPMIMELPITMLACARIGAVQLVVVDVDSPKSLLKIIEEQREPNPKIVVTCYAVKMKVDIALSEASQNGKVKCLTYGNESAMNKETTNWKEHSDFWWQQDAVTKLDTTCAVERVDAQKPLFILYTSESTGKPKEQTTQGYMIYTATTFKCAFDCKKSDVYWCTTDDGWITYGPLLNGATVVLYEGFKVASEGKDAGRCCNIVDNHQVTLFYTVPKLVRSLMGAGDQYVTRSSCKSLRVLGCVGEPLTPSELRWFFNDAGDSKYTTLEIWCQRETGGSNITSLPGASHQKPGSATLTFFAVKPEIVDEKGVEIDDEGIVTKGSWKGTFRILYGDQKTTDKKLFFVHYFKNEETQASTSST